MAPKFDYATLILQLASNLFLPSVVGGVLPARRDADVRKSQQPLDPRPLPHIVTFHAMPDELKNITTDQGRQRPIARAPRQHEQQGNPGTGERNAGQVDPKVDRVLMAVEPIPQGPPHRPPLPKTWR